MNMVIDMASNGQSQAPFIQGQQAHRDGQSYVNPFPSTGQPLDAHERYWKGWWTAQWRSEHAEKQAMQIKQNS